MLRKFRGAVKSRKTYGYHREIALHCGRHHFAMLVETTQCSEHFEESYMGCSSSADVSTVIGKLVAGDRTSKRSRKQVLSSSKLGIEQYRLAMSMQNDIALFCS